MTVEERMAMIDAKVENEKRKKAKEEEDLANETERLMEQIRELKPRIDDLIKLANYARRNGIEINYRDVRNEDYKHGTFVSNGWSHVVGFINENPIRYVGQVAGGAYGAWDFMTDGVEIFARGRCEDRYIKGTPNVRQLRHFVKRFPVFEEEFYKYIDSKCKGEN